MRADAPWLDRLTAEPDSSNYAIAIDEVKRMNDTTRRWQPMASLAFVVSLLGLLDPR